MPHVPEETRATARPDAAPAATAEPAPGGARQGGLVLVVGLVLTAVALRPLLTGLLDHPAASSWATVFVAVAVQAMPFLVLGVAASGAIAAFVPPRAIARLLPDRPA